VALILALDGDAAAFGTSKQQLGWALARSWQAKGWFAPLDEVTGLMREGRAKDSFNIALEALRTVGRLVGTEVGRDKLLACTRNATFVGR
jgi:hypothetical protein